MSSKFFESFQRRADALKNSATNWADEAEGSSHPLSQAYVHNVRPSEHAVSSDEDNVESPKMKFGSIPSKLSNKIEPEISSSMFSNRPISALLRPGNQKEVKLPTFRPTTLAVKPKVLEQHAPSQDLSAVLAKLSLMENKITSLIENKILALERKLEASDKRVASVAKAVEGIGAAVHKTIVESLNVSRGDLEQAVTMINDCTKESGSILAANIEEMSEKVINTCNHTVSGDASENVQVNNNEVLVITASNPHDTVHRINADELMALMEGNKVYVASSISELQRDLNMVREADVAEIQDDSAEEA